MSDAIKLTVKVLIILTIVAVLTTCGYVLVTDIPGA
jgi:hypothetical protein